MKLYFAVSPTGHDIKTFMKLNVQNLLVSYIYGQDAISMNAHRLNLMIDSGAFSVWNKGMTVDFDSYLEFCQSFPKGNLQSLWFINLDIIPGKVGIRPSINDIQYACNAGWNNYMRMKPIIPNCMHVFHQYDEYVWLERLLDSADYIGISPANDVSVDERARWLDKVYSIIFKTHAHCRTHGFGVTAYKLLQKYPFYSVDSSTWNVGRKWGEATIFTDDKSLIRKKSARRRLESDSIERDFVQFSQNGEYRVEQTIKSFISMESYITTLWEKRGIAWTDTLR